MKFITKLVVMICLPIFFLGGCSNAQTVAENKTMSDLSTDEALLAELQKRADTEREKLGLINKGNRKLEAKSVK